MGRRLRVYLADLAHAGMDIQIVPYCVGRLAAHAEEALGDELEVVLFKSPTRLLHCLTADPPDVLGLSNYAWNHIVSRSVARRAKARFPQLVVVGGGPHFPGEESRQRDFLQQHAAFDLYVDRDGELPFTELLRRLLATNLDLGRLLRDAEPIPGCHYLAEGRVVSGPPPARPRWDDEFPSPYLAGVLDGFLQHDGLAPITQFRRGCPFSCTFCVEGLDYYGKLVSVSLERFRSELEYIARHRRGDPLLYLTDANFGMYKEDLEAAKVIADVQARFDGWPTRIHATTGKQQTQRVLRTVEIIPTAMRVSLSLQTTDPETLRNVKRVNIPYDTLKEAVTRTNAHHQTSHCELILGLPGETVESHRLSLKDMVDAGVDRIVMYPLQLLPGTEMDAAADRERFAVQTSHQVLLHCHGLYEFADESFTCVESWECVKSNSSLSFEDYIRCRQLDLSVEVFYNDGYLKGPHAVAHQFGITTFEFVQACHDLASSGRLSELYARLERATREYHWRTREELEVDLNDVEAYQRYEREAWGLSLGSLKAVALVYHPAEVHRIAKEALLALFLERGIDRPLLDAYTDEVLHFCELRLSGLLEPQRELSAEFRFDLDRAAREGFSPDPEELLLPEACRIRFFLDEDQQERLAALRRKHSDPVHLARHIVYTSAVHTGTNLIRLHESESPAHKHLI